MKFILAVILCLSCVLPAFAQAPYLVKDINTESATAKSSWPREFRTMGAWTYFAAWRGDVGRELFRTDGARVELVKDLYPGTQDAWPLPLGVINGDTMIFVADGDTAIAKLFATDGTASGTREIATFPTGEGSGISSMGVINGRLLILFNSDDSGHDQQVWSTDGTAVGTTVIARLPYTDWLWRLASYNGLCYIGKPDGLWRTDGTSAGTVMVRAGLDVRAIRPIGPRLVMAVNDAAHGLEVWSSDGTDAGTALVKDINPGPTSGLALLTGWGTPIGGKVIFIANDGAGSGLWGSDGTAAGTSLIRRFPTNSTTLSMRWPWNGLQYFRYDGWLWRTDGTDAGTVQLVNGISMGSADEMGGVTFFIGTNASKVDALWRTDGTAAGTRPFAPAVAIGDRSPLVASNGRLFFIGVDSSGAELWASDGTTEGTRQVANIMADPAGSSNPKPLGASNGMLFFAADDGASSQQLWRTDASSAGTIKLAGSGSGATGSVSIGASVGSRFVFFRGGALWSSDGTDAGTESLQQVTSVLWTFAGSKYFYFAAANGQDRGLYRTDGTREGTLLVAPNPSYYASMSELGGVAYFAAVDGYYGTAGTPESTTLLSSIKGSSALIPIGARLFAPDSGMIIDPRAKVDEAAPFLTGLNSGSQAVSARGLVFYKNNVSGSPLHLWRSDGTPTGTFAVTPSTVAFSSISSLTVRDDVVYFAATDAEHGKELWRSDGTVNGTYLVKDIAPGPASSSPDQFAAAGGRLWFAASSAPGGTELWSTDGTADGTVLVADIDPVGSSAPIGLKAAGSTLYFSAADSLGRELWAVPLASTTFSVEDAFVTETNTAQTVRFRVSRSGDTAAPATISYHTIDRTAVASSDYVASSGTITFAALQSETWIDVTLVGDGVAEGLESFAIVLQPTAGQVFDRSVAECFVADDDVRVDLRLTFAVDWNYGAQIVVTNVGPFTAHRVRLSYWQSPIARCPEGSLAPLLVGLGDIAPTRSASVPLTPCQITTGFDPARPPGLTVGASVTASEPFVTSAVPTARAMFSRDERALAPPWLEVGGSGRLQFAYSGPATISASASGGFVSVTPAAVTIPNGSAVATLTLAGRSSGWDVVTVSDPNGTASSFAIAVVAPGATPRLDTVITSAPPASVSYGSDLVFEGSVDGANGDGAFPTGTIELRLPSGEVVDRVTLDSSGAFKLRHIRPEVGTREYSVVYAGDSIFNSVTMKQPATVRLVFVEVGVYRGEWNCGSDRNIEMEWSACNWASPDYTAAPEGVIRVSTAGGQLDFPLEASLSNSRCSIARVRLAFDLQGSWLYVPKAPFEGSGLLLYPKSYNCTVVGLDAEARSATSVLVTWRAAGASQYTVYRASSWNGEVPVGTTTGTSFLDSTAAPGQIYRYRVGSGSWTSEADIASTFIWTDSPLTAGATTVKAAHLAELVSAAKLLQNATGSTWYVGSFQLPLRAPVVGDFVLASDLVGVRNAIDAARRFGGVRPYVFNAFGASPSVVIRASDIEDLRNSLK